MALEGPRGLWLTQGHERKEGVPWPGRAVSGDIARYYLGVILQSSIQTFTKVLKGMGKAT